MSESKTYVFGNEGGGQGGMMSLLAPLLQQRGLDPNLLLAMNKNGNGWGDGFMWVIFLFFLMGWGGNGWGGFGNGRAGGISGRIRITFYISENGRATCHLTLIESGEEYAEVRQKMTEDESVITMLCVSHITR